MALQDYVDVTISIDKNDYGKIFENAEMFGWSIKTYIERMCSRERKLTSNSFEFVTLELHKHTIALLEHRVKRAGKTKKIIQFLEGMSVGLADDEEILMIWEEENNKQEDIL